MQPARFFIAAAGTLLTLVDGSPVSQCSSSTASSIGSISGYTSEGCFTEASSKRALTGKTIIDDSITVKRCSSFCSTYNFFGLENGRECYCGNAIMAGSVPTRLSECSFPCPGNTGELCGAVSRLNIYSKTSSSSVSGTVSVSSGSNSGSSQGSSSGNGGNTSSGSASGNGSSSSGSGNVVGNSNSNPSTGSSIGNSQGIPQQGSGNGNTSPGNGVTTKSPSVTPGGPLSTDIIVASVPSSYPWSNATTKATFSATLPTLSKPGTGVLPSPSTISVKPLNSTSSATLPTLSRPGTGVFPSPSTISAKPVNSTTISTLYPTVSASSSLLTFNTSSSTTILETTVASTSALATQSTDIPVTSVTSSSVPTITVEPSSSSASLESSTLSTLFSTSSLEEASSVTSAPEPTTIISSTIDFFSSSATLNTLTTSTGISTSSLDEPSITSTPEPITIISSAIESSITSTPDPTTIITSTIEPTSLPEITSTLTTLNPTPSTSSTSSLASPTSTNLIRDGDFEALSESSTIPWVIKYSTSYLTYNFENPATQATAYGARSASVTVSQIIAPLIWFNQPIILTANTVYNFSANTRASVISPGCTAYYYIGAADGTATTILAYTTLVTTNWLTNTGTYTSTSVTDVTINVRLQCPALVTTIGRTYYFDNISLVPATAAIATATPV